MNDIFEPRPFNLINSLTSLDSEIEQSFNEVPLSPHDAGDWIESFSNTAYIEWLEAYYHLLPHDRTLYCLGLNDDVWDSLYPVPEFYGFNGDESESEWDRYFYGIAKHKDQLTFHNLVNEDDPWADPYN